MSTTRLSRLDGRPHLENSPDIRLFDWTIKSKLDYLPQTEVELAPSNTKVQSTIQLTNSDFDVKSYREINSISECSPANKKTPNPDHKITK